MKTIKQTNIDLYIQKAFEQFEECPWLSWTEVLQSIAEEYETRQPWNHKKQIIEAVNDMRGE